MTESDTSERLSAGSPLGDGLRALARLRPASDEAARAILDLLQLKAASPAESGPATQSAPVELPEEELDEPEARSATPLRLVSDAERLPELVASEIEEIGDIGAAPPEWLGTASLIPLPATVANPFRRYSRPLFEPKWQRAIVTRLASVTLPVGEPDIERVVEDIACARPLAAVPRRPVSTAARGLRLLVDQGESMEPYRLDVADLTRSFRRTIGSARVSTHSFRGLPEWGCAAGLDWIDYRPPPAGVPVVVVSDLGLPPRAATAVRTSTSDWGVFFQRLERSRHHCAAVVPRDAHELPAALRRRARLVPWGRRTLASRLDQPHAGESAAARRAANVVPLGEVAGLDPHVLELGCLGSLAARIEPQLLRTLRLELAPGVPVGAEAGLWFSDLVAERAATGIVLEPRQREPLQRLLRRDRDRLDRAYALIEAMHREAAPALRVEEELAYRWLTGDVDAARRLLRSLVATLVAPQRAGVSKWAAQALVRLPRGLMALEETQMLALGTALRTGETAQMRAAGSAGGGSWHWLRPASREIELGVNLRRGLIEFGPRSMRASHLIRVPDANPVILDLVPDAAARGIQRVRLNPLARTAVEIAGTAFEISVIGGARWRLRPAPSARSSQRVVARNRAARVQIQYDVELYGTEKKVHLPFVMGVLSDLSGTPAEPLPPVEERKFLPVDSDNFDARMKLMRPRVAFRVPDAITGEGELAVDITFGDMEAFSPGAVAGKVDSLRELLEARQQLSMLVTYMDGKSGAEELIAKVIDDPDLLRSLSTLRAPAGSTPGSGLQGVKLAGDEFAPLLEREFRPRTDDARRGVEEAVQTLAREALAQARPVGSDVLVSIQAMIAELDRRLSAQLNLILHHEDFQRLEGAWRGLHYLVNNTETDEVLKIRVMSISKQDLGRTLRRFAGTQWDQSPIFRKIYEEEYGQFGGEPYGCLVGDYYFDQSPPDVQVLGELSRIAGAAHCPFIAGAGARVLQMDSWQELANPRDITKILTTPEYAAWRALRESEDARYIGLAVPRFLGRLPYGARTNPVEEFAFEEDVAAADHSRYTWVNSAYAMAANINRAFKLYGWCARIRGIEAGGAVEGLPVHTFPTDDGGVDTKCPTEIAITDRREAELAKGGLMALVHRKNTDVAAFVSAQSLQKPAEYDDPEATANAALAARLPYLFPCCLFAHYVKCIARDQIGVFSDRDALQRRLQSWLAEYVDPQPAHSSDAAKAARPLAAAEITIDEAGTGAGGYIARLYLRPHYQLEGLTVSLRLVVRLPGTPS